jgi:molybdopterin synthase catalytic subunit
MEQGSAGVIGNVRRAKDIITETKRLEAEGYPAMAELEIKKLVPAL